MRRIPFPWFLIFSPQVINQLDIVVNLAGNTKQPSEDNGEAKILQPSSPSLLAL